MKILKVTMVTCTGIFMSVLSLWGVSPLFASVHPGKEAAVRTQVFKIQVPFIENQGQVDDRVAFYASEVVEI
jgi:hypothetical protein